MRLFFYGERQRDYSFMERGSATILLWREAARLFFYGERQCDYSFTERGSAIILLWREAARLFFYGEKQRDYSFINNVKILGQKRKTLSVSSSSLFRTLTTSFGPKFACNQRASF